MVPQMTPQPRPQPHTKSLSRPVQPMKIHTLQGDNTRISYLSSYLTTLPSPFISPLSADEITKVKLGLKDAHRGLEKLESEFRGGTMGREVKEVTTEVWRCYVRCRVLEEGIRELKERRLGEYSEMREMKEVGEGGDEDGLEKESGNVMMVDKDVVIRKAEREQVVVYVPSGARKGKRKMLQTNPEQDENGEGKEEAQDETESIQTHKISGPLPTSAWSSFVYQDTDGAEPPYKFVQELSRTEVKAQNGHDSWNTAEGSTTLNSDSIFALGRRDSRRMYPLKALPRPRIEILAKIEREEARESVALQDPDRVRQGSTSGGLTTLAIMSGMEDDRYVLPSLDCIKIHEVKCLKKWLVGYGYLRRAGVVSEIERVLHFIFAMQMGCRLETLALLFSRSPRQVESSCKDVLEGILQLHSETELPRSGRWPMYAHLWHMSEKYKACSDWAKDYYPWSRMDFEMAIVTLNLFISRYRKQGHLALDGASLDWGKYVQRHGCNGWR